MKTQNISIVAVIIVVLIIVCGTIIYNRPNKIVERTDIINNKVAENATSTVSTMIKQANEMAQSLINKDYEKFSEFAYPKIVSALGGKDKYIQIMENSNSNGSTLSKVTFGKPVKIVDTGTELQTVLPQTLEIKIPAGLLVSEGALIAISPDKGETWYFIDTGGNNLDRIRTQLPNISTDIIIPILKEPVLLKNQ